MLKLIVNKEMRMIDLKDDQLHRSDTTPTPSESVSRRLMLCTRLLLGVILLGFSPHQAWSDPPVPAPPSEETHTDMGSNERGEMDEEEGGTLFVDVEEQEVAGEMGGQPMGGQQMGGQQMGGQQMAGDEVVEVECAVMEPCGNGHCAPYCGECELCPEDCGSPPNPEYCPDPDFDYDACANGEYYDSQGFPEVNAGGPCSQDPNCPTLDEFCAQPANRGVGVTACTGPEPCDQGGSTPVPCPCGSGIPECPDGNQDECQDNCDCVGTPGGARCREDDLCGNRCDLNCLNRRDIDYPGEAFSSCEMVCPTARLPALGNVSRGYFYSLPSFCQGGSQMCLGAPPLTPAGAPQLGNQSCGFYLRLKHCFTDCGACEKNRLEGYYHICKNIRGLMNGVNSTDFPGGLPREYRSCTYNSDFTDYADGMMFCLQAKVSSYVDDQCLSCSQMVNGQPDRDVESGIIGAHTECNNFNGFCDLVDNPGRMPLKCFGAAMGKAWGSILGHQSPIGTIQPVGICHALSQVLACADGSPRDIMNFQSSICEGYVDGCMSQQNLGDMFPICRGGCSRAMRRALCEASCPQVPESALVGIFDIGPAAATVFEQICNRVLTRATHPFGFPILPGTSSGRDPCLTY